MAEQGEQSPRVKAEPILSAGPWAQVIGYRNVLCPDGRRRTVRTPTGPDSFVSAPGRVQVKGRTVSGFVFTMGNASCGDDDAEFRPSGRNAHLLG